MGTTDVKLEKDAIQKRYASYREVQIGKTLFRVTSIFKPKRDFRNDLLQWAVDKAIRKP